MPSEQFKAMVLTREQDGTRCAIETMGVDALPEGDVLVVVDYSSLNYKDGLAVTGKGKVVRRFPMVPGIDLAGTVLESDSPNHRPGDEILVTGCGMGELHWGGYSRKQRLRSEWLVPLPKGLDSRNAMALGTAGFTAMLSVMTLEEAGVGPKGDAPVVVTGASGGVGSLAVSLLAASGYEVAAATGRRENEDYLRRLGASKIIDRESLSEPPRPLESERWSGAIDTVGGTTLARLLAGTRLHGCVAACGLAASAELQTTVMPFILRGVSLRGVDSAWCPMPRRREAWRRLAREMPAGLLQEISRTVSLEEVPELSEEILRGRIRGRVVVEFSD
jgi:acrylyl-CoA reductase (NADPH)